MTTLYRPVLIESAEQAEAMPVGTFAIYLDQTRARQVLTRTDARVGPWEMDMRGYRHELLIGFTALVPVEVEEIHSEDYGTHHLLEAWTSTHPITAYLPKETQ